MIAEALAGKRIAVTGATGFLGTAIVERLLRSVPGCEVVLLVRAGRRSTAAQRVQREIIRNDAFDRLRAEVGGATALDEMVARRVQVVTGDVGTDGLGLDEADRAVLASCDIVHPLGRLGRLRLAARRRRRGQPARPVPHRRHPERRSA